MEIENQEQEILMENEPFLVGGGAVDSVNGMTGDVVLTTSDIENTSDYQTGTEVAEAINTAVSDEATIRQNADNNLQSQIDGITASSDVKDIVGTYADLQDYDTSTLSDNDIIKVLQDETHQDETTYYRWNSTTQEFTLIGEEGPYYTKAQTDVLLQDKQDTLTAGDNITIDNDNVISATDTTYSDFVGTDGTAVGTAGLVPAPATTDADKYLKSDGTWDTVNAGPTVVQTTGTSTTDVMSQNATTGMVFADPGNQAKIRIGNTSSVGTGSLSIGNGSLSTHQNCVAVGDYAQSKALGSTSLGYGSETTGVYSVSLGYGAKSGASYSFALPFSSATEQGIVQFGLIPAQATNGYNNSQYRLLTGLYDPVNDHDASTKGYVDNIVVNYAGLYNAGAPTTSTVAYYLGQFYYDTTNDDIYYCSDIDTTDPNNPVYTWSALPSGGGGGPTVVQTTGTSTTDVMSQNATTSMVFADAGTNQKVQVGNGAAATGGSSVSIGRDSKAEAVSATAVGRNSDAKSQSSTAVGHYARTNGESSVAIGETAIGGSLAGAKRAVAIGSNSIAGPQGSIAIGAYSYATTVGEMNIGAFHQTGYGYNNTVYRLLSGLYDGQSAHDAVTVGQINATIDAINTALSTSIPHIGASS